MKMLFRICAAVLLAVTLAFGSFQGNANAHINWVNPPGQFQVDATRPGWTGSVAGLPVGPGQSRNHIVAFDIIQNDLAIILNNIVAANTPANRQHLIDLTEALFPTNTNERTNMRNHRTTLQNSINAGATGNYNAQSRSLLSDLNSSPDNIRVGNSGINASIGENIDADFNAGTIGFPGPPVNTTGPIPPKGSPVLTLIPASETVLYAYQEETTQGMTFVIDPNTNLQLSSVIGPTNVPAAGRPFPVYVRGAGTPYLYQ